MVRAYDWHEQGVCEAAESRVPGFARAGRIVDKKDPILAFVVLFTPLYFTTKIAMATRKAMLGDVQGATDELKGAAATAGKLVRRGKAT